MPCEGRGEGRDGGRGEMGGGRWGEGRGEMGDGGRGEMGGRD